MMLMTSFKYGLVRMSLALINEWKISYDDANEIIEKFKY